MARKGQEGVPGGYKRCSKCGEVKEFSEFGAQKGRKNGRSQCKKCRYLYYKTESFKARVKAKREANIEKTREIERNNRRRWREKNREKHLEYSRYYQHIFYENHKDRLSLVYADLYRKNRDRIGARKYFVSIGISAGEVPKDIFDLKVLQLKLKHAVKDKSEGHKEVTNGKT